MPDKRDTPPLQTGASFRSAFLKAMGGRLGRGTSLGLVVVLGMVVVLGSPWGMGAIERTFAKQGPETYQAKFGDVVFREGTGSDYVLLLSDYDCSHCRSYFAGPFPEIVEKIDATIVFRNIGMDREPEAVASLLTGCSPREMAQKMVGRFMTDDLPAEIARVEEDIINAAPQSVSDEIAACLGDEATPGSLANGIVETRKDFTIIGTPTLVVNGRSHAGGLTHEKLATLLAE